MKVFLTAEWKNLINLTYRVDPEILMPHIPKGLELDIVDGAAFVSLVAFDFLNTKVRGIKIPFHVDFPEINLRYYVKHKEKRGVAFLKEYVPRHCIAFIAQKLYNEPYFSFPMESSEDIQNDKLIIEHKIWKDKDQFGMRAETDARSFVPPQDSTEHYFKEHDLGFGSDHAGKTIYYRVSHPVWEVHPLYDYRLNVDFEKLYGKKWGVLNELQPFNRLVAKGSQVTVFSPGKLEDLDNSPIPASLGEKVAVEVGENEAGS